MFDYERLIVHAIKLCEHGPSDLEKQIATAGLNARQVVEQEIAHRHPAFEVVLHSLDNVAEESRDVLDIGDDLMAEFEAIRDAVDAEELLLKDVDCLALLAGMFGFMERFQDASYGFARFAIACLENSEDEPQSLETTTLLVMGMWFADYNGFRENVRDRVYCSERNGCILGNRCW